MMLEFGKFLMKLAKFFMTRLINGYILDIEG